MVPCAIYTNFLCHLKQISQVDIFRVQANIKLTSLFKLDLRLINLRLTRVCLFTLTSNPASRRCNFLAADRVLTRSSSMKIDDFQTRFGSLPGAQHYLWFTCSLLLVSCCGARPMIIALIIGLDTSQT
jgi:hypothetical protein